MHYICIHIVHKHIYGIIVNSFVIAEVLTVFLLSGLGYIVGSKAADIMNSWRWALRVCTKFLYVRNAFKRKSCWLTWFILEPIVEIIFGRLEQLAMALDYDSLNIYFVLALFWWLHWLHDYFKGFHLVS